MFFGEVDGCVLDAVAGQNFIWCGAGGARVVPSKSREIAHYKL